MPLYVNDGNWFEFALHCITPSLGDGLIVMLIFGLGWTVRGQSDWTDQPGRGAYALMLPPMIFRMTRWWLARMQWA